MNYREALFKSVQFKNWLISGQFRAKINRFLKIWCKKVEAVKTAVYSTGELKTFLFLVWVRWNIKSIENVNSNSIQPNKD